MRVNESYVGERLEEKINRIVNNKEPITDGAPLVYTERKEGVVPATDIRTDRFEVAVDAMDKVAQQHRSKRKKFIDDLEAKNNEGKEGKGEAKDIKMDGKPDGGTGKANQDGGKDKPSQ